MRLIRDLCGYETGVVAPDNDAFFSRICEELPFRIHQYPSGASYNGWMVPQLWQVHRATISRGSEIVFDGTAHPLAVAAYSKSFEGELDSAELKTHLVTNADLPTAYVYHCMWQYRPWDADWAFCIPHEVYETIDPGSYRIDLETSFEPGQMLVAEHTHPGRSEKTIVFNAHTCHPCQANDDFAGVAILIRLFQELRGRDTYYTYKLILGPEHLGTVFYLRDQPKEELERMVSGAFAEMPGTQGAVKVASSFLGDQAIDLVFRNAARHHSRESATVPWRQGAGNDETVWEAAGYEVPFVEVSRSESLMRPYREYHSSLDTADLMDEYQLNEFYEVFRYAIETLEKNCVIYRKFNGIICLSNPEYDLYVERPDPAVVKDLADDSEKWGYLGDCLARYMDGSLSIVEIAERHDLPFVQLYAYLARFEEKGLVRLERSVIERHPFLCV